MPNFSTRRASEIVRTLCAHERAWSGWGRDPQVVCSFLDDCAAAGETEALPCLVGCFIDHHAAVRSTARRAAARLLALLKPHDLLSVAPQLAWFDYEQQAWLKLQPQKLAQLLSEEDDNASAAALLGLASFHRNGYVRHFAVQNLASMRNGLPTYQGLELPFLIIRQNDWVSQIAADARAAVSERIAEWNLPYLARSLKLILHLQQQQRHDHSHMVQRTVALLLRVDQAAFLRSVVLSGDREVIRAVMRLGLGELNFGRYPLIQSAAEVADPVVRLLCCRALPEAIDSFQVSSLLRRFRGDPSPLVRREALATWARLFPEQAEEVWQGALFDRSGPVRELAQFHLRSWGVARIAAAYRQALADRPRELPAVQGLAETAEPSDVDFFRNVLEHPVASWRCAAIHGLARAGDDRLIEDVLPCLYDSSSSVVRAARSALEPQLHLVPDDALFTVAMKAAHPFARRNAVLMIFGLGRWRSLPWLIRIISDAEPATSQAAADAIMRWCSPPRSVNNYIRPDPETEASIREALASSTKIPDDLRRVVLEELGDSPREALATVAAARPRRDLPEFAEALRRWTAFLRDQGVSGEPLWIFREDIVERFPQLFVKTPVANHQVLVERIYKRGLHGGIGISLEVACLLDDRPCCYLWVPQDEQQACYRMVRGLKMSIPMDRSLRIASSVSNSWQWTWLKWREQVEGKTRWVDAIPRRVELE